MPKEGEFEKIDVDKEVAIKSLLIKNLIEDGENESIPLQTITKKTLKKIVEYCEWIHANGEPTISPLRSNQFNDIVTDEWLQNYVNVEKEFLFEIALAANFLNILSLLELTSAKIAS